MTFINILVILILSCNLCFATLPPKQQESVPQSQSDINDEVSAMIDAQNQQAALQNQQAIQANNNQSDTYSNCPNCSH